MVTKLAELYETDPLGIALVCDKVLDREGLLIVYVREKHREIKNEKDCCRRWKITNEVTGNAMNFCATCGKSLR